MGRIGDYFSKGSAIGLVIMLFVIPAIPCILVWNFIAPITVLESIMLFVVCMVLYILCGIAELIIVGIIGS